MELGLGKRRDAGTLTGTSPDRGWSSHSRRPSLQRSPPPGRTASPTGPGTRSHRTLQSNTRSTSSILTKGTSISLNLIVALKYA